MHCVKCRGEDIHTAWHGGHWECSFTQRERCDWRDNTEHLHYFCRGCGYTWAGPTKDKP